MTHATNTNQTNISEKNYRHQSSGSKVQDGPKVMLKFKDNFVVDHLSVEDFQLKQSFA
jgi:hypothetical protein